MMVWRNKRKKKLENFWLGCMSLTSTGVFCKTFPRFSHDLRPTLQAIWHIWICTHVAFYTTTSRHSMAWHPAFNNIPPSDLSQNTKVCIQRK